MTTCWFIAGTVTFLACLSGYGQRTDKQPAVEEYVRRYQAVAVQEMKEFGIPASITLAQGIVESNAGRSALAREANNHFGIKCHKEWTGPTYIQDDETRNECFRKYGDPRESYRDHSRFLAGRERYKTLFTLKKTDFRGWANGLKAAGYATNPAYADMLIRTIETYSLQRFDEPAGVRPSMAETRREILENNGVKMVRSLPGDDLYTLSRDLGISVRKLLRYNELPRVTAFRPGQEVYLAGKRRKAEVTFHTLKSGETVYSVAQFYGIKTKMIYRRNSLEPGSEPGPGMVLRLR